jgi:hypothetical protein
MMGFALFFWLLMGMPEPKDKTDKPTKGGTP